MLIGADEPFDEAYEIVGDPVRTLADIIEFFYDIIFIEELNQFYVWFGGVYKLKTDEWINSMLTGICRQREEDRLKDTISFKNQYKYGVGLKRNVISLIKGDCLISQSRFRLYHNLINCKNGVFNMDTLKFTEHPLRNKYKEKGYYPFIQLAIDYNPKAKCPTVDTFIKQIFQDKWRKIYEVVGSYITTDVGYQTSQWLYGFGANGKGVFAKLMMALLGKENTQIMTMRELLKDYSIAELQNKLLNVVVDIDMDEITNTGLLKQLTGGDDLNSRKKYVQKQYPFENTCHLLVCCNTLPRSKDNTYGWWRRLDLYPLTKTFRGRYKDKTLIHKLTTKSELEGLLIMSINGLLRLRWRGGFIEEDVELIQEKWFLESDPLGKFILTHCIKEGESLRLEFVETYNKWRKDNNMAKVGERYVSQHLKKKMPTTIFKRKRGLIPAKYIGIKLVNGGKINIDALFRNDPNIEKEVWKDEF